MNCVNHPAVVEQVYACSRCGNPFCTDCLVTLQGRRYCARCKSEQITDIQSGVDAYTLPLAGIGRRFAAIWIDGFILGIPTFIIAFIFLIPMMAGGQDPGQPPSFFNWISYAVIPVYIVYEGLMLSYKSQTVGKMAMRIKVVQANGGPISKGQAWGRSIIRSLFVSFLALINYLPALFTKEKTCIHDMAAKTRVVMAR
jgi:uncharacterized RDD family membrane protein YckC